MPTFRKWFKNVHAKPNVLVEPFAGGGIISLTALFERLVPKVVMVELDEEIAAVWQAIVAGNSKWLLKRILSFDLTRENVIDEITLNTSSIKEKAFQTILKNRTYHGGILADGSGLLKNGENGKGIKSRWYPETLARRLNDISYLTDKIDFRCEDGLKVMKEYAARSDVRYFIDPPYTAGGKKAGNRLYRYCELDHEELFKICESLKGDFLMTYDNAEEVKSLARKHGFQMRLIPMTNTHHATMEELIIGKDLIWLDKLPAVHEPSDSYITSKCQNKSSKKNH